MNDINSSKAADVLNKLINQRFFPQYGGRYGADYGQKKLRTLADDNEMIKKTGIVNKEYVHK